MSVRGYAKSRGMAHTSVDYQIRKGRIPLIDGKIDPEYADMVFREKVNKMQSRRGRGQQRKAARSADFGGGVAAGGAPGLANDGLNGDGHTDIKNTGGMGLPPCETPHADGHGAGSLNSPSADSVEGYSETPHADGHGGGGGEYSGGGLDGGGGMISDGGAALAIPAGKLPELPDDSPELVRLRAMIPTSYDQAQFLSAVEDLMKRRAANAEAEGKLTATDRVARAQFEMARQIRDAMLGIVPRLQDDLAVETDPGACGRLLAAEIRLALESAAKQAAALDEEMASLEEEADAAV